MKSTLADNYVSSLSYDVRLAPYDIKGSVAHVTMLGKQKILDAVSVKKIIRGLESIKKDLGKGRPIAKGEDIHFAIEKELIKRIGSSGKMMHTARSRNDQVVTDLHLYLKDQIKKVVAAIKGVEQSIVHVANQNRTVVMPGFTHLQHAQPILFAHHLLAYAWMLERDKGRFLDLEKRVDVLPLGSAALAGTSFPINRSLTAKLLKFKAVSENSIDSTGSRDVVAEFLSAASILMANLSRLAEEMIIWSSSEFSFIKIADEFTTGSSIMPQKNNPDMAELVRGKTGRVFGSLIAVLTLIKGTPLAYNRDLQEDKPPLFDAVDTVLGSLDIMKPMIKTMKVNQAQMALWCHQGHLCATELADYLSKKGVPFRSAHGTVRELVSYCSSRNKRLDQLSLKQLKKFHSKFNNDVFVLLRPKTVVQAKKSYGGTSPDSVRRQIEKLRRLAK